MTVRVQLIVTGELERLGLHLSLRKLFASTGADVEFLVPQKTQDFTSNRVGTLLPPELAARSLAAKLAGALVLAVYPGRGSTMQADHVIAVDDLELANADQPGHVLEYFRHAVKAYVDSTFSSATTRDRVYQALAERGSFHLLAPMVESYFFGEAAALQRATAHQAPNRFDTARDLEDFEVDDAAYLAATVPGKYEPRHRHPKNYVRYLCDPTGQRRAYRETHEGLDALRVLDWTSVLRQEAHAAFARALIDDVADALNVPSPCPGVCSTLTVRKGDGLLRNI
ncbi:hypothetical protein ATI61_122104 [Archangium gephyra]|uniref:Uncharacterized protein n=1 Tax=Archangium gephyra TaxID=48 RepID=A0AAC8Q015_9BACT|nr:hypothetical protein [Archangium gephyra]AKI98498.1 Hypothetical protein AA314_00125 [Archangium gephyra]REG20404.1 hypothetical protein ATI61_122104 [Archangium gephyra]